MQCSKMFLLQIFLADKEGFRDLLSSRQLIEESQRKGQEKSPFKEKRNLACIQANWTVDLATLVLIFPIHW